MARRASRDTFAYERVGALPGDDTEVRRQVFAGQMVPDTYRLEDEGAAEEEGGAPKVGLGAAPHGYKHQVDADGNLRDEHQSAEATERQRTQRGRAAQPAPETQGPAPVKPKP